MSATGHAAVDGGTPDLLAVRDEELRAAWRDACADLAETYDTWRDAGTAGCERYWAVVAAIDREEAAAAVLASRATPGGHAGGDARALAARS
jgi:hypothetical protein